MTEATTRNALVIDAVVLPVASFVLGLKVRSSRCMVLTILNLICIVIISFASLGAIADRTEIDPFASSIVMSLGIALCFDYSLFVLSRFREELSGGVGGPQGTKAALRTSLATAGHVVLVSGSTLSVTFLILIPFPQNFFLSIGIGCGIVIVVSMACVLTLTPALILSFQWFSSPDECKAHSVAHYTKVGNSKIEVQIDIFTDCDPVQEGNLEELVGFDRSCVPHGPRSELHPQSKEGGCRQTSKSILKGAFDVCSDKLLWLKMTLWVAKHGWFTLAMVCIAVGPFAWKFFSLRAASNATLTFMRGSRSMITLDLMKSEFSIGVTNPYTIMLTIPRNGTSASVLCSDYFAWENALIHDILSSQGPKYVASDSIQALSYFGGQDVSFPMAMNLLNPHGALVGSVFGRIYSGFAAGVLSVDQSASLITLETVTDPDSDNIFPFIENVRQILSDFSATSASKGFPMQAYLVGGYTATYDQMQLMMGLVKYLIASSAVVVVMMLTVAFGSLCVVLILFFTVCLSVGSTFGMLVVIYQDQAGSPGVFWMIPMITFSILMGLAVDYGIFLTSRFVEFRKLGWSERASIVLANEKSGGIITTAGVIMAISFAGLLTPPTYVLNQYGFSLFVDVIIDTFIMRSIVVPAIIGAVADLGRGWSFQFIWWPTQMPPILLCPDEEEVALLAGHLVPQMAGDARGDENNEFGEDKDADGEIHFDSNALVDTGNTQGPNNNDQESAVTSDAASREHYHSERRTQQSSTSSSLSLDPNSAPLQASTIQTQTPASTQGEHHHEQPLAHPLGHDEKAPLRPCRSEFEGHCVLKENSAMDAEEAAHT